MQDGSQALVDSCSTYSPVGPLDPKSGCPSTIQGGIPLAYADEPYWLASQAQCRNPAGGHSGTSDGLVGHAATVLPMHV